MHKYAPSDWKHLTQGHIDSLPDVVADVGQYIESVGKTDLAEYTEEEFKTLLLVAINSMAEHSGIPF